MFQGTTKQIHKLLKEINQIHSSIQFPMEHTTKEIEAMEDKGSHTQKNLLLFGIFLNGLDPPPCIFGTLQGTFLKPYFI